MSGTLAIIGIGHLAEYIVHGLRAVDQERPVHLLARSAERAARLAAAYPNTHHAEDHQDVLDAARVVIVATRPDDLVPALKSLRFTAEQTVISVAAGVSLRDLAEACAPARAVRSLPLACVRIHCSPTLIYPDDAVARSIFEQLGSVHVLSHEDQFAAGSALTGALYAWLFALQGECQNWAEQSGLPVKQARALVQDTFAGAAAMAQDQSDQGYDVLWDTLATPGGISEQGHRIISDKGGFHAFSAALSAVRTRLSEAKT